MVQSVMLKIEGSEGVFVTCDVAWQSNDGVVAKGVIEHYEK